MSAMTSPETAVRRMPLSEAHIMRLQRGALTAASVGAIVVAAIALSARFVAPHWPSVAVIAVLGVGLAAGPVVRRSTGRSLHRRALLAATSTALVLAILGFSSVSVPHVTWWPEWGMAAILGAGLAVEPARRILARDPSVPRPEQAIGAVAAMAFLVRALGTTDIGQHSTLYSCLAILGLGLVSESVVSRLGNRSAACNGAAAMAALLVLGVFLQNYGEAHNLPTVVAAVILAAAFAARPVAQIAHGEPAHRFAPSIAAAAAMAVAVVALTSQFTRSTPAGMVGVSLSLRWPVVVVAIMLATGAIAVSLSRQARERSVLTVVCAAGIAVLLAGVASASYSFPVWPEWAMAAILAAGLGVASLSRLAEEPRERVLSERVRELSRTRTGALDVQASELRRIERDLHDGAQARLVALSMKLGRAEDRFDGDDEIGALLREAREDAAAAIRELRELARGIAPPVLTDRGLEAAVGSLAQRTGSDVRVSGRLSRRPLAAVELAAYFVVAESLTNAAKHAPGARVEVRLDERGDDLFIEVTDFGPGGADPLGGGLTGLRQRVEALDGALHVTSPAGVGTQVEAVLPCGR